MHYEEVRPYDLLSLLMEVDGIYRAPLYEKTLDKAQFSPVSYSYIRFSFHLYFHRHVCSGFRLRLLRVVLCSENGDFAWVDYFSIVQLLHIHSHSAAMCICTLATSYRNEETITTISAKGTTVNTWWSNNSNTLNMHRKISRKQLFAWVLPTTNSSFFIHFAVRSINYSSLAIVCNSMWVNYKMSVDHFRSKLSFQVPIIRTYNNCLFTPPFTENNFNFTYEMVFTCTAYDLHRVSLHAYSKH